MKSHVERTIKHLVSEGYEVSIVERYIAQARIRMDMFNFADIVAIRLGSPIMAVQVCGADWSHHYKKICSEQRALIWLECGGSILLIGWRPIKGKITKRIHYFTLSDFENVLKEANTIVAAEPTLTITKDEEWTNTICSQEVLSRTL